MSSSLSESEDLHPFTGIEGNGATVSKDPSLIPKFSIDQLCDFKQIT